VSEGKDYQLVVQSKSVATLKRRNAMPDRRRICSRSFVVLCVVKYLAKHFEPSVRHFVKIGVAVL